MKAKMSVQKTERLIENVRENKSLYDPAEKDYADFEIKAKIWSIVAAKCSIKTGNEAKMMWKNLRDCYRIYRNRQYCKPNSKKWKFYKQMDFLEPYIRERKFRSLEQSLPPATVVEENIDTESRESVDLNSSIHINESEREFTTIQYWNDTEPKFLTTEIGPETTQVQEQIVPVPAETETSPESALESDHESFEDILPEALNNGTANNSLKMFFDAMYASTSQLPPSLQRTVKNKIFAAVLEEEEEAEKIRDSQANSLQLKLEM